MTDTQVLYVNIISNIVALLMLGASWRWRNLGRLLVAARGGAVTLGLVGAVVFLLAIAPLGRGSAFPFSLTVSVAAGLLLRHRYDRALLAEVTSRIRRRRAPLMNR